jgi:hypothetical protein
MSTLAAAILVAMEKAAPCGRSNWSVEPVPAAECAATSASCPHAKRSSFYGGWVRKEGVAACTARRAQIASRLAHVLDASERPVEEAAEIVGIAINESGLREDVQMGRGRSERIKPTDPQYDDAGGQGRGPANEACLMQVIPSMAKAYGGAEALLGASDEALDRCFRAGLSQLRWARAMCSTKARTRVLPTGAREDVGVLFATISRYGTGTSCLSDNMGKTSRRVKTVKWMTVIIKAELRK